MAVLPGLIMEAEIRSFGLAMVDIVTLITGITAVLFAGLLGASAASFLNVAASGEKSLKQNVLRKKSVCESCGRPLVWWELLPVLGWLLIRGRCSRCKEKVTVFHPLSELLLFTVFSVSFVSFWGSPLYLLGLYLIVCVMYFFSVFDIFTGIVPNKYIFPVVTLTLVGVSTCCLMSEAPLLCFIDHVSAGLLYFVFFVFVNFLSVAGLMPGAKKGQKGFGWGDAKYAIFVGLVLGVGRMFVALWIAVFAGALVGVILILSKKKRDLKIPYAPFMSIGAWVSLVWGYEIMEMARRFLLI